MLVLTKGNTAEELIVTLNEKRTLSSGYYLFVFTHFTTKEVVNKIYNFAEDDSTYPTRYNNFPLNTQSVFGSATEGQWTYDVYEQASSGNTNTTGLTKVETGVMVLKPATAFAFETYEQPTTYETYGG